MQVSPGSLDRILYGRIFWKAYGWNCTQNFCFSKFFLIIFSQPPKKWLIFWKSIIFHIFRSGDFCVQQTHAKNVTNRKYRSSAFQKIKFFWNQICIFENTTFLSRRIFFPKCEGKLSIPLGIWNFLIIFLIKWSFSLAFWKIFFFADLKMLYFQKYKSDFENFWFFGKLRTYTFD